MDFAEIDKVETAWLQALAVYDKNPTDANHLVEDKTYDRYLDVKDDAEMCYAAGCRTHSPRARLCRQHKDDPKVVS